MSNFFRVQWIPCYIIGQWEAATIQSEQGGNLRLLRQEWYSDEY